MRVRYKGERRSRDAHLQRAWKLHVTDADPYDATEPDLSDLEVVSATRPEREALRKAGFILTDTRPMRRAA